MYQNGIQQALNEYRTSGAAEAGGGADPHRLVQMLFQGALEQVAISRGAMEQGNVAEKGQRIGRALEIIEVLQMHLDMERGGEVASNLEALYDYMQRRLAEANLRNDLAALDEVSNLLREIKAGWDAIPTPAPQTREMVG